MIHRLILITLCAAIIGCGSTKTSSNDRIINVSSGGGISGLANGIRIRSNGTIEKWKRFAGEQQQIENTIQLPPDSVEFYFRYLDEIGFRSIYYSIPSNMTYVIELITHGESHLVKWSVTGEEIPNIFNAYFEMVQRLYQRSVK